MQRDRAVLVQRPPHRRPSPSSAEPPWWYAVRGILPAFGRQVLLRPARIGTLALLAGMTAVVLVGAEGWWIVLGITLFQAAASALVVTWVDLPTPAPQPTEHHRVCWFTPDPLPRQRTPGPDE